MKLKYVVSIPCIRRDFAFFCAYFTKLSAYNNSAPSHIKSWIFMQKNIKICTVPHISYCRFHTGPQHRTFVFTSQTHPFSRMQGTSRVYYSEGKKHTYSAGGVAPSILFWAIEQPLCWYHCLNFIETRRNKWSIDWLLSVFKVYPTGRFTTYQICCLRRLILVQSKYWCRCQSPKTIAMHQVQTTHNRRWIHFEMNKQHSHIRLQL